MFRNRELRTELRKDPINQKQPAEAKCRSVTDLWKMALLHQICLRESVHFNRWVWVDFSTSAVPRKYYLLSISHNLIDFNFTHHSLLTVTASKTINEITRFFFFFSCHCSQVSTGLFGSIYGHEGDRIHCDVTVVQHTECWGPPGGVGMAEPVFIYSFIY